MNNQVLTQMQTTQHSSSNNCMNVLNEAASKGFKLNFNDFIKFANMMKGKDAQGILNELRESGQMTDEMYQSLETKANGLMSLVSLFKK